MSRYKSLQLMVVGFIILVVLTVSIKSTFDGYYGFYYNNKEYEPTIWFEVTKKISQTFPFRFFSSYTGFDTGYGFFSPNVASDFIFVFKIYDSQGQLIKLQERIDFKAKESTIRFSTFHSMFLEKLNEDENNNGKYDRYLDIIIEQVSQHLLNKYPPGHTIETELYLYDYPTINQMKNGKEQVQLFLVKKYSL